MIELREEKFSSPAAPGSSAARSFEPWFITARRSAASTTILAEPPSGSATCSDKVELVVGDVRDPATVARATRGVESVCHLAYINGTEFFYDRPELILEVAVKGMMNVLDACLAEGCAT